MPTGVFAASEDFGGAGERRAAADRIDRAAGELADLVVADQQSVGGFGPNATDRTRRGSALSAPAVVTPFDQLLQGHRG